MIARVIDRVAKHLAERVHMLPTGTRLHYHRLVQAPLAEPREERLALRFDCLPPRARRGERRQVPALQERRIGVPEPAVEPELFRPHDVAQRAVESAVAALQVAEIRFGGERLERREEPPVGPRVVGEQLPCFGRRHGPPFVYFLPTSPARPPRRPSHSAAAPCPRSSDRPPPASPSRSRAPPGRSAPGCCSRSCSRRRSSPPRSTRWVPPSHRGLSRRPRCRPGE